MALLVEIGLKVVFSRRVLAITYSDSWDVLDLRVARGITLEGEGAGASLIRCPQIVFRVVQGPVANRKGLLYLAQSLLGSSRADSVVWEFQWPAVA